MHPVALAALGGFGVMAIFVGIAIWELHQQERAYRESAYHSGHPSYPEYQYVNSSAEPAEDEAQNRCAQPLLLCRTSPAKDFCL